MSSNILIKKQESKLLKEMSVNAPKLATKQLKLQSCSSGRKLTISSNWLILFGFSSEAKVVEKLISKNKGIKIVLAKDDDKHQKKVYTRQYKSRKRNPYETQFDIRGQRLLDEAFPSETTKVHITFEYGVVTIVPITNKQEEAIKQFKKADDKLTTFLACSSGVDGYEMSKAGFKIESILEFRKNEKRDISKGIDTEEIGCLNAINNFKTKHIINEDIMSIDLNKIAKLVSGSNYTNFTISPVCSEFSPVKANSLKDKALEENETTLDMVIDVINIIDKFNFPTILIENVPAFFNIDGKGSDAGKILEARLKRFGYRVFCSKLDARDFGGLTSRIRGFLFATMLPAKFEMPKPTKRNDVPLWELLNIEQRIDSAELRDVTHCKTTHEGVKSGRIRLIKRDSFYSGSVLRSQMKQTKDSIYIYCDKRNRYYFPNNKFLSELMGIDMSFETCTTVAESEFIGQSIDVLTHNALTNKIKEHIFESNMQLSGKLF